ncbi:DUF2867 domain-containing protein [Maridesulfovibrio sp.]|uniref:DUF2867 domain-containing protein n=1 Tax=Maridesulfovibrio sp. TaxID=2795000 RepID=UPI0039EE8C9E
MAQSIEIVKTVDPIKKLITNADHMDSMAFESHRNMEDFLIRLISYKPGWLKFLYKIRGLLVGLLGLKHDELVGHGLQVSDYDFKAGGQVDFFQSVDFEAERFWIGEAVDKHLSAYIGVVSEPVHEGLNRYHVFTIVHYRHWTGPLYFNLIRPFHYLVVYFMGRNAAE